jgi:hypothetical protein
MYVDLNKFKAQVQAALEEGTGLFGAMKSEAPVKANTPAKAVSFLSKAKNLLQSMPAASKTTKFGIGAIVVAALAYVGFIRPAASQKSASAEKDRESTSKWQQFQSNAKAAYQSASSSVSGLVKEYPRTAKVMGLAAGAGIVFLGSKLLKNSPAAAPTPAPQQPGRNDYWTPEAIAYRENQAKYREEQANLFCPEMEIYPTSVTNTEVLEDALESGSRWEYPDFAPEIAPQTLKHTPALHQEFVKKDMTATSSGPALLKNDEELRKLASAPPPSLEDVLNRVREDLKPALDKERADADKQALHGLVAPFGTRVELGNGVTHIVNNNVLP